MHELSIVQNIVETTAAFAKEQNAKQVKYLTVQVGGATGVIPKYLQMYYPEVCAGTLLEKSELRVEEIEAEAWCRSCGTTFYPFRTRQVCPHCGGIKYDLLHGEELMIKEIGFV